MKTYLTVPGIDTGIRCTANSLDVIGNVRVRLAVGGEAGIIVEEDAPPDVAPNFVAIYFHAEELGTLVRHLQAMQAEFEAEQTSAA